VIYVHGKNWGARYRCLPKRVCEYGGIESPAEADEISSRGPLTLKVEKTSKQQVGVEWHGTLRGSRIRLSGFLELAESG
jgi:hypothetical protein